jgi:putative membrane protein
VSEESNTRGGDWRTEGEEPDYRFTLANERTFLAWTRTGLAIVAGAVVLDQFGSEITERWIVVTAGLLLCAVAVFVFLSGYVRWRRTQRAMRRAQALPPTRIPEILTGMFVAVVAAAAVFVLLR